MEQHLQHQQRPSDCKKKGHRLHEADDNDVVDGGLTVDDSEMDSHDEKSVGVVELQKTKKKKKQKERMQNHSPKVD